MQNVAAHFLLNHYIWNSPPNDALSRAYDELGYQVDYYAPCPPDNLPNITNTEYGVRWLLKNIFSLRWRKYSVLSCTSEDPIFVVGIIAFVFRKPIIFICDEIRSGSYVGDRPWWYKKICRWAMRRANLTIVNDVSRINVYKEYASLVKNVDIVVYPGCFYSPPKAIESNIQRKTWNVPKNNIVVAFSGSAYSTNGIEWALQSLEASADISMLIQPLSLDPLTDYLLRNNRFHEQLIITDTRLTWTESWQSMGGVDIGIALYLNPAEQFQNMGISSNRLCMFLAMGIPVITTKQPSFEFIESYNCGVMVSNHGEFVHAINKIKSNLPEMKKNALQCCEEYINCKSKFEILKQKMKIHL